MNENPVTVLSSEECWQKLSSVSFGRLVTRVRDVVDIVPINFVATPDALVFRTAAGNKLTELMINPQVVFEADSISKHSGWSVVVHGRAHILETDEQLAWAQSLPLKPFVPTVKTVFVRIDVDSLSGRNFSFGPEPDAEEILGV